MRARLMGKIVNPPSEKRVHPEHKGTLAEVRSINKVAKFIAERGWNVIFEKGGEEGILPALRVVTINTKKQRSSQLITLLHEAGHAMMFTEPDYEKNYGDGYLGLMRGKSPNTLRHKMGVLREEIAAWDRAELILDVLDVSIDIKKFRDSRNKSLKTYVEWTAQ